MAGSLGGDQRVAVGGTTDVRPGPVVVDGRDGLRAVPFFPLLLEFENNQPDRSEPVPIIKIDEHQPMADLNGRLRVAIDCKELV